MWVGHFAIGLAFFLFLQIAIVADYSARTTNVPAGPSTVVGTAIVLLAVSIFIFASVWQYLYHCYLASLRKYTLPVEYGANYIVAPHYTADCLIYLCLAIVDAPHGLINWSVICVLAFTVVNLGVTADGTKKWQLSKFRDQQQSIQQRWRMLPGLW